MASTKPVRGSGETGTGSTRVCHGVLDLTVALCAWLTLAGTAHTADSPEFWPEISVFVGLNPQTRVYLDAAYAKGKEPDTQSLDLAAYLDISLKPILRNELQTDDWQRSRYLWARIGYDRIFKVSDRTGPDVAEHRGIVSIYAKAEMPAQVWVEGRVRADLRWIGGDYSTRYRFRIEATREFTVANHTVVPYFNVEWFYDTRYDGWAGTLYQMGPEVTVTSHFRYEIYLARKDERLPSKETLNALGFVAKWYY
jgi:hypothetical protein